MGVAYINDLTDTWNSGVTTYQSIKMVVTDTASASDSNYAEFCGSDGEVRINQRGIIEFNYTAPFNLNGMGIHPVCRTNTFFGGSALNYAQDPSCTFTGTYNTALGFVSLLEVSTCSYNTAFGAYAGRSASGQGKQSTVLGTCAGCCSTNSCNTLVGYQTGWNMNTTVRTVAIGMRAGCQPTASNQVLIGSVQCEGAPSNTSPNIGIGFRALCCGGTQHSQVGLGRSALACDRNGNGNLAIGEYAGGNNTTAAMFLNVYVGACAGLRQNGDRNTNVGAKAGCTGGTHDSSCNTYIGACSGGVNGGTAVRCNEISVGYFAATLQSTGCHNRTNFGYNCNTVCNCVYTSWSNVSDCRDKTDIKSLPENYGLTFINRLKPSKFKWDIRDTDNKGKKFNYGFIAQDIKETIDDLGISFDALGYNENQDAFRLSYTDLISPLTLAVQQLACRIDALED